MSPSVSGFDAGPAPEAAIEGAYRSPETSPAEAQAINDNFNIVVYGCAHGVPEFGQGDQQQVDIAYDAAAHVIDTLDPANGDKLFIEGLNHDDMDPLFDELFDISQSSTAADILKSLREQRAIDPMYYAQQLARIKNIPVITADMHMNTTQQFEHVTGAPTPAGYDQPLFGIYNTLRNEQAAATIKEEALATLPHLDSRQPTYALLIGPGHTDSYLARSNNSISVPEVFDHMGLQTKTELLPNAYGITLEKVAQEVMVARSAGSILLQETVSAPSSQ